MDLGDLIDFIPDSLLEDVDLTPQEQALASALSMIEVEPEITNWRDEINPPKTDDELWEWVSHYLNIQIPRHATKKQGQWGGLHTSPFQAFADAYFARYPRTVWFASRGFGGKSVLLATLALTEAITLGCGVTLLGGSGEQAQRVLKYMAGDDTNLPDSFWAAPNAPRWLLKGDTARVTSLKNGGYILALMASQKSVRGPHPQRLRGDEIDEMAQSIWDSAQGQPMEARGVSEQTVGSSTWQNPAGTMLNEFKEAQANGWPIYEWDFEANLSTNSKSGWLTPDAVERKKASVGSSMWRIEYELQEPSIEGRLFQPAHVEAMFSLPGRIEGGLNTRHTFEEPVPGARYAIGADWAKTLDRTIIFVLRIDVEPYRVVFFAHLGRIPFPDIIKVYNTQGKRYNDAQGAHDKTGMGNVIHDYLEIASEGVTMVGAKRSKLFLDYVDALERGEIVSPMIDYVYNEHKYVVTDDIYGTGHPPDSVVGGALVSRAANSLDMLY